LQVGRTGRDPDKAAAEGVSAEVLTGEEGGCYCAVAGSLAGGEDAGVYGFWMIGELAFSYSGKFLERRGATSLLWEILGADAVRRMKHE